jgi:hypothetical protein
MKNKSELCLNLNGVTPGNYKFTTAVKYDGKEVTTDSIAILKCHDSFTEQAEYKVPSDYIHVGWLVLPLVVGMLFGSWLGDK